MRKLKSFVWVGEVRSDKAKLIVGKASVPEEVMSLADDFRADDFTKLQHLVGLTGEMQELCALHFASGSLSAQREIECSALVAEVVPGSERVINLGRAVDRRVRSTRPDDYLLTGIEMMLQRRIIGRCDIGNVVSGGQ